MTRMTLALLVLATACNATTSNTHASASSIGSPKANFAKYQTFSFGPANAPASGYEVTPRSMEVQRRLALMVQTSLQERGYQRTADKADLVIKISAGSGMLRGDEVHRGDASAEVEAGFIGIDAYDGASGAGIWRGFAFAEIDPEHIDEELLKRGVNEMLATFPARNP